MSLRRLGKLLLRLKSPRLALRTALKLIRQRLIVFATKIMTAAWLKAGDYRFLDATTPRRRLFNQRLQRRALKMFLKLPDRFYRKRFAAFERGFTNAGDSDRDKNSYFGIMLMIGTLGPGGAERQAVLTAVGGFHRGWRPLRLTCAFLKEDWQRFFLPQLEAVGIPVGELARDSLLGGEFCTESLLAVFQQLPPRLQDAGDYYQILMEQKPAVAHLWLDECNIKGGLAAVAARVPRIVLGTRSLPPHNFSLHQPYMREGYRWLLKQTGVVLLNNSRAGARAYEEWLQIPTGSIQVVYNGFDFDDEVLQRHRAGRTAYRHRHGISAEVLLVGTVMRLSEEKRPLLWLEIAAAVHRHLPDVRFLMAGDGNLRSEVQQRADCDDLGGVFSLVGYERQALDAIAALDLFLLTSRAEGLPNVLVEAQALGIPIITTDVGGASETVCHGVSGWVLDKDEIGDAAAQVVRLLQDTEWRCQAGLEAHRFVSEKFGVGRMLDDTLDVYGACFGDFK